ncbi:MAG: outer membrane protein assembly factor BamE [Alphaproteobacteria bacterium]
MKSAIGLILVASIGATGCAKTVNHRGYLLDEAVIEEIRPGVDNRGSVLAALGSPSVSGTFDDDNWYYISRTQEHWAFFKPDTTEHNVVVISFDDRGSVANVGRLGLEDTQDINTVERKTPTRGKELGFFEQIFSNIGRFSGGGPAQPGN